MNKKFSNIAKLTAFMLLSAVVGLSFAQGSKAVTYNIISKKDKSIVGTYKVPDHTQILSEPNAEEILYGRRLLAETKRLLPNNAGANMNCNSCHIAEGKARFGAHYINSVNIYPRVMPRSATSVDLPGRVNGCFQRSMNGVPLDLDSKEMKAIIAYMKWLAKDVPAGHLADIPIAGPIDDNLVPDPVRGKKLYAQQCAACHGDNGEGKYDNLGIIAFPPLWGDESFNIGAGMARTYKAAAFIKYAMPMGVSVSGAWGQGGVLNDQDAVDIAEYFSHQPRPDFPPKIHDWPKGNKPKDARY